MCHVSYVILKENPSFPSIRPEYRRISKNCYVFKFKITLSVELSHVSKSTFAICC